MKVHFRRTGTLMAAAVIGTLGLTACGNATDNATSGGGGGATSAATKLTVTFIPKNLGNPYFDTSDAGGKKAIGEFGGTYSEVGPQQASPDAQVQYINTAAQQRTSALVVSSNDPKAICDALNQARKAGTKVATSSSTRPRPKASPRSRSTW